MNFKHPLRRPVLSRQTRYRWDPLRREHQIVFSEGVLVLNESAAAIAMLCDGRLVEELVTALAVQFPGEDVAADVDAFLTRLSAKGLLCDAEIIAEKS